MSFICTSACSNVKWRCCYSIMKVCPYANNIVILLYVCTFRNYHIFTSITVLSQSHNVYCECCTAAHGNIILVFVSTKFILAEEKLRYLEYISVTNYRGMERKYKFNIEFQYYGRTNSIFPLSLFFHVCLHIHTII